MNEYINVIGTEIPRDPYEELANAIIVRAAKDYEKCIKNKSKPAQREARLIERFFQSDYYEQLSPVDGNFIIHAIKDKVKAIK